MNIEKKANYFFENNFVHYKSLIDDFTDEIYDQFDKISQKIELINSIDDLISGKIVNKTENQAAYHPLYRSYKVNSKAPKHLKDAETIAKNFFSSRFNTCIKKGYNSINIVTLGTGGSYEGPKLLLESLDSPMGFDKPGLDKINYEFITGSDSSEFKHKIKFLEPDNTFFIVSSKSFTTLETLESLKNAFNWCKDKTNFIAITANPNKAKEFGIEEIIFFDKEIGGRYSVWSPVTQFHLSGKKREDFFRGGYRADLDILENKDYLEFVKRLSFADIFLNSNGKNVRAILSYLWKLRSIPNYFQQLEMESLGKHLNSKSEYDKTGQVIFGGYGPIAQHSYFQLLHQGTQGICVDIISSIEDKKSLGYVQAITQSELLAHGEGEIKLDDNAKINGNVPANLFLLKKLDAFNLGYLIATWEYRTFITAVMTRINPFDQFGVNAGKIYTDKYLGNNN